MRIFVLFILMMSFETTSCQDSTWQKFRIDSNVTVKFKGVVEKMPTMAVDKYSYQGYSARANMAIYTVMIGTSKENIGVFDKEDYQKTLDDLVAGALKAATENAWKTSISDIVIDSVPGRMMSFSGKYAGFDAYGRSYFFLVNGLAYTFGATYFRPVFSREDSVDLAHYVSSIDFTSKVREMQFATKAEYVAYSFGKLIGMFIVLAIVIIIVIFVVRMLV